MKLRAPDFDDVRLVLDEGAIRAEMVARGVPGIDVKFAGHPSETPTVFASGETCDLNKILNGLAPTEGTDAVRVRHVFDEPVFAEVPGSPVPRLRVQAIEATIRISEHNETMRVNVDHLIAYCFRDVLGGTVKFLRADGGPLHEGPAAAGDDDQTGLS